MDLLSREMIAQGLGILAFVISLVGYLSTSDRRLRVMMTSGLVVLTVHFLFFGAWLVALSLGLNTVRTWLSLYFKGRRWFVGVALIQLAFSLPLVDEIRDVFPIAGSLIGSYGLLCLSGIKLRVAMLITTACWFVSNLLWGSIGGVMLDTLNASAHVFAMYRMQQAARKEV
jgi:hypothetical protein